LSSSPFVYVFYIIFWGLLASTVPLAEGARLLISGDYDESFPNLFRLEVLVLVINKLSSDFQQKCGFIGGLNTILNNRLFRKNSIENREKKIFYV